MGHERKASWLFLVGSFLVCLPLLIIWLRSLMHQKREPLQWVALPRDLLPQVWSADQPHCHHLEHGRNAESQAQNFYVNKISRWFICTHGPKQVSCCLLGWSWVATSSRFWGWEEQGACEGRVLMVLRPGTSMWVAQIHPFLFNATRSHLTARGPGNSQTMCQE